MAKILIVEDERPMLEALKAKFKSAGFSVEEAVNGEEGLTKALGARPDFILLDIIMPKMDGITMLKKLRKKPVGKNIPVIILTNLADSEKALEAAGDGALDFLVKTDWRLSDLVKKVKGRLGLE